MEANGGLHIALNYSSLCQQVAQLQAIPVCATVCDLRSYSFDNNSTTDLDHYRNDPATLVAGETFNDKQMAVATEQRVSLFHSR